MLLVLFYCHDNNHKNKKDYDEIMIFVNFSHKSTPFHYKMKEIVPKKLSIHKYHTIFFSQSVKLFKIYKEFFSSFIISLYCLYFFKYRFAFDLFSTIKVLK